MRESNEAGAGKALPDPGPGWLPQITLPMHGSTRYLRVRLEVRDGMLRWEVPRVFLGLVPVGRRCVVIPVEEVGSVVVRRMIRPLLLAIGAAAIAGPLVVGILVGRVVVGGDADGDPRALGDPGVVRPPARGGDPLRGEAPGGRLLRPPDRRRAVCRGSARSGRTSAASTAGAHRLSRRRPGRPKLYRQAERSVRFTAARGLLRVSPRPRRCAGNASAGPLGRAGMRLWPAAKAVLLGLLLIGGLRGDVRRRDLPGDRSVVGEVGRRGRSWRAASAPPSCSSTWSGSARRT